MYLIEYYMLVIEINLDISNGPSKEENPILFQKLKDPTVAKSVIF